MKLLQATNLMKKDQQNEAACNARQTGLRCRASSERRLSSTNVGGEYDEEQNQQGKAVDEVLQVGPTHNGRFSVRTNPHWTAGRFWAEEPFGDGDARVPRRAVQGDAQCSQYNVNAGQGEDKVISDNAVCLSDTKPGRGTGHGEGRGGAINGKEDSRGSLVEVSCPSEMQIPK